MATIIKTDGTKVEVQPKDKHGYFSLEELQDAVGGYIELAYLKGGKTMVINEEGKILGLKINVEATKLYSEVDSNDYIVGDVLVCMDKEIR